MLTINHGENKNERIGETLLQNTVAPWLSAEGCADGWSNGVYSACWPAYSAFVTASIGTPDRPLRDLGPVIWPRAGYVSGQERTSSGVLHPHSLVAGGFIYVYYLDGSVDSPGIKLARAPLTHRGRPRSWRTLTAEGWRSSLPAGFSRARISVFYERRGPEAHSIFGGYHGSTSFAVARQGHGYIGFEEYQQNGKFAVALRRSRDLIHWSARQPLTEPLPWSESRSHYPIPLDRQQTSNTSVGERFYLLGTDSRGGVWKSLISAA